MCFYFVLLIYFLASHTVHQNLGLDVGTNNLHDVRKVVVFIRSNTPDQRRMNFVTFALDL